MITVRDVWRGALPDGTELLAGGAGLERRVEWATALRTRPPAFDAVKGGEIAFVPVKSIRLLDERLDLAQVMASLAEKGGVAVVIVGDASSEAIAVADRMMLPLLKLPAHAAIPDMLNTTVRYVLDQRTRLHEKEHELRLELTELALAGAGVAAIVERLAGICACAVVWQGPDGAVLQRVGTVAESDADLSASRDMLQRWLAGVVLSAADPPVREFESGAATRLVAPIPLRSGVGGYISVVASGTGLQLARIGVARAAAAAAIELDRERAVLAARDDIEGDIVGALLSGAFASEDAVVERARRLGVDVEGTNTVAVIAAETPRLDTVVAACRKWAESKLPGAPVTVFAERICIVVTGDDAAAAGVVDAMRALAADVVSMNPGLGLAVGVGRAHPGVAGVRVSHDEAVQAAVMGRRLYGLGSTVAFAELGLHRLLFAMAGHAELRAFHEATMGTLRAYDAKSDGEFITTLEAFFACHGSPTEMAGRLHVHRNTVLYRLRRIAEVGGIDLDDPMTRLRLHLSLRVGDVLEAPGG